MPKYLVSFTQEKVVTYGYYVDAKDQDEAYTLAEDKYLACDQADNETEWDVTTLNHEVEEVNG